MPAAPLTATELRRIPLFVDLADEVCAIVIPLIARCDFAPGEQLLRAGEYFDGVYYLLSGQVEARAPLAVSRERTDGASVLLNELPDTVSLGGRSSIDAGDLFG